jgi:hypothetical protein
MYTGKELNDCFANLHMTVNNEIRTVKQEIKETNERVGFYLFVHMHHLEVYELFGGEQNVFLPWAYAAQFHRMP